MHKLLFAVFFCMISAFAQAALKDDIRADMQERRWSAAEAKLDDVLKRHPTNATAHYWQAQVKEQLGLPQQAREHLAKAKQLKPDLSFASNAQAVTDLERRLRVSPSASPRAQPATTSPVVSSQSPAAAMAPAETQKADEGHGLLFWLFALGIPLAIIILLFRALRRGSGRRGLGEERARLSSELKDIGAELRDAEKAIDGRPELNAEQRMALADRLSQAQGDIARESAALASRNDFAPTYQLIMRVRDIAAEARGEEKPSIRAERMRQEAGQSHYGAPGGAMPTVGSGPGLGTGLLAGAALGAILAGTHGSSQAADTHSSSVSSGGGYEPIDSPESAPLDFGPDDGSDWGDSSSDSGSGSDDW